MLWAKWSSFSQAYRLTLLTFKQTPRKRVHFGWNHPYTKEISQSVDHSFALDHKRPTESPPELEIEERETQLIQQTIHYHRMRPERWNQEHCRHYWDVIEGYVADCIPNPSLTGGDQLWPRSAYWAGSKIPETSHEEHSRRIHQILKRHFPGGAVGLQEVSHKLLPVSIRSDLYCVLQILSVVDRNLSKNPVPGVLSHNLPLPQQYRRHCDLPALGGWLYRAQ